MTTKQFGVLRYSDYDDEGATVSVNGVVLTAANFDAQVTLFVALMNGIAGITLGLNTGYDQGNRDKLAMGPAAVVDAQRERKWLVQYKDSVELKHYNIELPCADLDQLDANDRQHAEIGDAGVVDAFIDAFEAYARSPAGNPVTVLEITHVGRNV